VIFHPLGVNANLFIEAKLMLAGSPDNWGTATTWSQRDSYQCIIEDKHYKQLVQSSEILFFQLFGFTQLFEQKRIGK
jgi:hypothetical protein